MDGASKLKVKLNDGRTFEAKLIGKDSATDLALLKIEASDLPTVPFGSSDALRLGEGCWRSVRLSTCNRPSRPAS